MDRVVVVVMMVGIGDAAVVVPERKEVSGRFLFGFGKAYAELRRDSSIPNC